jgi:hypothetical protein
MHSPADDAPDPTNAAPADGVTDGPPGEETPEAPRERRRLFRRRPKAAEETPKPAEETPLAAGETPQPAEGSEETAAADDGPEQPTGVVETPPKPPLNPGRMRRERRRLAGRRQETLYHLGGLAFELFRRDMLVEPVMRRRAEEVADIDRTMISIDEQLATIEEDRRARREERRAERREARASQKQPAGYCLSCGAPHREPANFCANCGSPIVHHEQDGDGDGGSPGDQPTEVVAVEGGPASTQVMEVPPPGHGNDA